MEQINKFLFSLIEVSIKFEYQTRGAANAADMNLTPNKTSLARTAFNVFASSLHRQTCRKQAPQTQPNCELCEGKALIPFIVPSIWRGKHVVYVL